MSIPLEEKPRKIRGLSPKRPDSWGGKLLLKTFEFLYSSQKCYKILSFSSILLVNQLKSAVSGLNGMKTHPSSFCMCIPPSLPALFVNSLIYQNNSHL